VIVYDQDHPDRKLNVLIAGGSTGLGRALYEYFCDHWKLDGFGMFARNVDFEAVDNLPSPLKHNLPYVTEVDATDVEAVDHYFNAYESEFGSVTHLVCTLGVYGPLGQFVDNDVDEWMAGVENNLFGPMIVAKRALPNMIKKRFGKIVFLSGGGATHAISGATSYCAAKTGLVRFAETLAHEVHPYGIAVNCVAPGLMKTRFLDQAIAAGDGGNVDPKLYHDAVAMKADENTGFEPAISLIQELLANDSADPLFKTGNLISAVWDNFQHVPFGLTDKYSLARKVTP
jgi:NAD(P)-dependent dehydrogenase (short-subunit alcohol dehydrogenase family)